MRLLQAVCMALLVMMLITPALAQPTEWDRAWWFREQVGLSPTDLAALDVEAEAHEALIEIVREHFAEHAETDGAVIDRLSAARRKAAGTISWGRDPGADFDHLRTERQAVILALGSLAEDAREMLPSGMRPYLVRAIANAGINSPYRLLNLTAEQRTQIIALQRQRDTVLLDARQRHRAARLDAARECFAEAVEDLLTEEQQTELAVLNANIAANLEDVWAIELADYPADEYAQADDKAAPLPKYVLAQAKLVGRRLSAILVKLAPKSLATPVVK